MKFTLPAILLLFLMTGCNPMPNSATQPPQTSDSQPKEAPKTPCPASETPVVPANLEWKSLYIAKKDDEIRAHFEKAYKIISEQKGIEGELNDWSYYFGQWLIVEIKTEPTEIERMMLDGPARTYPVFLFDMAAEKIIEMGDWRAAKPFFEAQANLIARTEDAKKRTRLIERMASSASVVGLGHTNYVENSSHFCETDGVSGPVFKHNMNGSELVYFIHSTGMALFYTKCTLKMTPTSIEFNSEIINE